VLVTEVMGPPDDPTPSPDLDYKDTLLKMCEVNAPVEFAVAGKWADGRGVMSISVEGFGDLRLPLSDLDAKRLAQVWSCLRWGPSLLKVKP
jgi:hypothetical protein